MERRSKIKIEGSTTLTVSWSVLCLFLLFTIIFSLVCILITPKASDFRQVLSSFIWKQAALNTLLECICSTTASVLIGFLYAYCVVKGALPFRKFFAFIPLLHLVTPPFVGGLLDLSQ